MYDNEQWRLEASTGISRFLKPFTIAGYIVMAAAGLSVLNVFVLGLVQRKREPSRAAGDRRHDAAGAGRRHRQRRTARSYRRQPRGAGRCGLTYLWSLGSPVFYGMKIEWGVLGPPLVTGVAAVLVLLLAATVYPVIHARRLEAVDVLRATA